MHSLQSGSPPKHSAKSFASLKAAQAEQPQRYQLFPKDKPLPTPNTLNLSKALPIPQASDTNGRVSPLAGIRIRLNQNNLVRRRKVSVTELGPMTTVQEVSMDSPTIPGRPPLHERSSSAPGKSTILVGPIDEILKKNVKTSDLTRAIEDAFELRSTKPRPSSPRKLAPLVIPPTDATAPRLKSKHSSTQLRSGNTPPNETSQSGRFETGTPSIGRLTPASTPDLSIPRSATATEATTSTLPTPISAPLRSSPHPWEGCSTSNEDGSRASSTLGHRRAGSESSSIMDRGRPSKRNEKSGSCKTPKSSERRAFEELPAGWKPCEAISKLSANDVMALHRQALGQAERFEVLKVEDVEALSKELRQLDDRTEYLRRTYGSLRAGRRNLHSRICQYLRSPRVAKFSHDSMLKQEEALAELDASIDDWVTKLEQAENRRTRVRQKLLEHVAAAAILPVPDGSMMASPFQTQGAPCPGIRGVSTPPRSPTKHVPTSPRTGSNSPSPQRVVAQVPSAILEHPLIEEQAAAGKDVVSRSASTATTKGRMAVESIRVYAGDDLYALLADVEDEISRLGTGYGEAGPMPEPRKEQARKRSQEKLNGDAASSISATAAASPSPAEAAGAAAPSEPRAPKKDLLKEAQMLLTNAVFKPRVAA
ncbi:hypothetical protein LLEC1_06198 [Akanthomyces lecanii]|uniref:Up-regulated during septation protein 1 domain-containing protein n=1 Tax=Cordyceps confragosa TaxID=2714763 RepID=A0A179IIK1_CORDF|nr:hypothetical protein LLEC1_06198 [Akanthomyces lecanii]